MGNLKLIFPPPQHWQEFEQFVKGVVDTIWEQVGWQIYGRPGQIQSGIDIFGYDDKRRFTGIQCKKKEITDAEGQFLTISLLTEAGIKKEVKAAEKIKDPSLERLIFATTSSRDTGVQDVIRKISDGRINLEKFTVEAWFWQDFQVLIENHISLQYLYFSDILQKVHHYDKNIHILTLLRRAFTRPAFRREMRREESGVDFIQAIKDTQEAITTGRLYNRRGELIASSYPNQKIDKENWKKSIRNINKNLDKIKKYISRRSQSQINCRVSNLL